MKRPLRIVLALVALFALPGLCAAADPAPANIPPGLTPEQQEKIRQAVGFSRPADAPAGVPPGAQFSKDNPDKAAAAPAKPEPKRTTKPIYGDIIIHK